MIWDDETLPPAKILAPLMYAIGFTYPTKILDRRIGLLTKREKKECDKLWKEIASRIHDMESIIAERAEEKNDPWKK